MSIWDICFPKDAFLFVQCPYHVSLLHDGYFCSFGRGHYGDLHRRFFSLFGGLFGHFLTNLELVLQGCQGRTLY